jgi:hypothetical protein
VIKAASSLARKHSTCHGFVLFFAGKLCAAAYVTQKVQPFAAMLPVLPFGVLRLSDRAWSMIPKSLPRT